MISFGQRDTTYECTYFDMLSEFLHWGIPTGCGPYNESKRNSNDTLLGVQFVKQKSEYQQEGYVSKSQHISPICEPLEIVMDEPNLFDANQYSFWLLISHL